MGIKKLNDLLKRYAPDSFSSISINELRGRRVAIDTPAILHAQAITAAKKVINRTNIIVSDPNPLVIREELTQLILDFACKWLRYGVVPVFVFDGTHPESKDNTKKVRRERKEKSINEINLMVTQLRDQVDEEKTGIEELRIEESEIKESGIKESEPKVMVDVDKLRRKMISKGHITGEDIRFFYMLLKRLGLPVLTAKGDGEQLCTALCIEGLVAAVYSTDTDNIAMGCPLLLTKTFTKGNVPQYTCVKYSTVLQSLKMSKEQFLDLCIMCGCDFNSNIPGIGIIGAHKLITQHGSIDNINHEKKDILNHHVCRDILKYKRSNECCVKNIIIDINSNKIDLDFLESCGQNHQINRFTQLYQSLPEIQNGHLFPLRRIIKIKRK